MYLALNNWAQNVNLVQKFTDMPTVYLLKNHNEMDIKTLRPSMLIFNNANHLSVIGSAIHNNWNVYGVCKFW